MINKNHTGKRTEVTSLPTPVAMTKEDQICVMIIPQLCRLESYLRDNDTISSNRLNKIISQLTAILDEGEELK